MDKECPEEGGPGGEEDAGSECYCACPGDDNKLDAFSMNEEDVRNQGSQL